MMTSDAYTLSDAERTRIAAVEQLGARAPASVDELVELLVDPSWIVRRAVIEALTIAGEAAVEPLCTVLREHRDHEGRLAAAVDALVALRVPVEPQVLRLSTDRNPAVVADAAQILGRRRSRVAIPVLVQLTRHASDNVAVAAIEALGRIGGSAAVEALVAAIDSGSFFRTFPAIDVLGRSGDPRAVEPLARLLASPHYLPEAARALGRSGDRGAVKPLLSLLGSRSDAVVRVAAVSLLELREHFVERSGGDVLLIDDLVRTQVGPEVVPRLIRGLSGADVDEALAICSLLGMIGNPEAAAALTAKLDGPRPVATAAAEALRRIGKDAEVHLIQAIREGSSERRKVLLPTVTRSWAATDLVVCLEDPDPEVRALACDSLARLGNPTVVPRLFGCLGDPNLRVVHSATAAIQALGTQEARDLALEATRSEHPVIRRAALRILAYFGDRESLAPMIAGLDDPDPRVRDAAVQGLPYVEDPRAREALFEASKRPDSKVRALAMRSLGHVPKANERVYSLLLRGLSDGDAWVRYYACQALGRLAYAPAAAELAQLLTDEAGQVRVSAVEALSHLESREAHEALRHAAESADVEVRRAALVGLGIAQRPEDLPLILAALGAADTPTRLMALSATSNFRSPRVLAALSSAASDADDQVRAAAIGLLAARPEEEATEILIELLASDATHDRAKAALLVPSEGRIAGLLMALASAGDELAPSLISVLARIHHVDGRAALLSAMKMDNVAARKAAATALAAGHDLEMLAALRDAADHDPDEEVREICALLLSE
jgi:HEAT repeat protein